MHGAFGLRAVRGPLLSSHTPLSKHRLTSDVRTDLYTLYATLPPADLALTITPSLDAYDAPHLCRARGIDLSWEALTESGCRYFLLDAYSVIYVYRVRPEVAGGHPATAPPADDDSPDTAWPPSKTCLLWKDVTSLRQQRLRTARVVVCTGGTPDGDAFESYIEAQPAVESDEALQPPELVVTTGDGTTASGGGGGGFSFNQFLVFLRDEVTAATAEQVS